MLCVCSEAGTGAWEGLGVWPNGQELGVGSSILIVMHYFVGGFYGASMSQLILPILMWIFSQLCDM